MAEVPLVEVQPTGKERRLSRGQFTTVSEVTLEGKTAYAGKTIRDSVRHRSSPDWVLSLERGLRQECQLLGQLSHPNIVLAVGLRLEDSFSPPRPTLVMELLNDGNLDDYIAKRKCCGKMDEQLQHMVLLDIARGLKYIHGRGIVHYTLNSRKILLTFQRPDIPVLAKIGGFGAASMESKRPHFILSDEESKGSMSECTLATYAPEVFSGLDPHEASSALDIFSFGVVILQTVTQETPLPLPVVNEYGGIVPEVERRMKYLDMLDDDHPLKLIVMECLSNQPEYRPTAEGILDVIEKAELRTHIPVAEVKEMVEHNRQAFSRLRLEKDRFCNERDRTRQRLEEISEQYEDELGDLQRRLELSEQQVLRQATELSILRRRPLERSQSLPEPNAAQQQQQQQQRRQQQQQQQQQHEGLVPASQTAGWCVATSILRCEVKVLEEIGRGAWAAVARGRYRQSTVAVKWPHEQLMRDYPDIIPRLEREIGIMARVRHPNIVHFIGAVLDDNSRRLEEPPLIIAELLDTNLRREYMRCKTASITLGKHVLQSIFLDVAYGIHCLHTHNPPIIHRDISAPNVLLKRRENCCWLAKISDFGSANLLPCAQTPGEGAIIYTAPEVFPQPDGVEQPVQTPKIDVYSYGRMLCEVIAAELPTNTRYQYMLQVVSDKWEALHGLIEWCTQHCPTARPSTVEIIDELNRIPRPPLRSQLSDPHMTFITHTK